MYKKSDCKPIRTAPRHRVTLALDGTLWDKFQPILQSKWGGSFTSWLEYSMECFTRDSCDGCPYESEEEKPETPPDGAGKATDD